MSDRKTRVGKREKKKRNVSGRSQTGRRFTVDGRIGDVRHEATIAPPPTERRTITARQEKRARVASSAFHTARRTRDVAAGFL